MARLTQQGAVDLVNDFINENDYYNRLPVATLANVLDVQTEIAKNPTLLNEFMGSMVNKIVGLYIQSASFVNPLKRFKMATGRFGDTIEEVFVGIARERQYDSDAKGEGTYLLSTEETEIRSKYHRLNRKGSFKRTVLQKEMVRALTTPGGLADLVSQIIEKLVVGNEANEYAYMKSLLDSAYKAGDLYLVEVGDISKDNSLFATKAKEYSILINYINQFNAAGVDNTTSLENTSIFLDAESKSKFDVETLAGAFNMDKTDLIAKQVVIDRFQDDNVIAVMVDNSFFVVQDKLEPYVASQFFADSLKTNYFLHVDQIISRSPFATAIAFVKEIPADMKHRLQLSKDALVLNDGDAKSQEIHTKLTGFDGNPDISDYTVKVEHGPDPITDSVVDENGVITFTLKDGIPAGKSEDVRIVATDDVGEEVTFSKTIRIQKSSDIIIDV